MKIINILIIVIWITKSSSLFGQPEITFDSLNLNLGEIKYGLERKCEFKFTNTGNKPLLIESCQTGDGGFCCATFIREPILPGGKGIITFAFLPTGAGQFHKSGTIISNANHTMVSIQGNTIYCPFAYIENPVLDLKAIEATNAIRCKFRIKNYGSAPLVISKIEPLVKSITPYFKDTIPMQTASTIEVLIDSKGQFGPFKKLINVYTNADSQPIQLTVTGKLEYSPLQAEVISHDSIFESNMASFSVNCFNNGKDSLYICSLSPENSAYESTYLNFWSNYVVPPHKNIKISCRYNYYPKGGYKHQSDVYKVYVYSKTSKASKKYTNVIYLINIKDENKEDD